MQKFTKLDESKKFIPDPTLLKTYASFLIPLYINKIIKIEDSLIDEYLDMFKKTNRNENLVCDLEIEAVKLVVDNPTTINGFTQLKKEIESGCPKLQTYMKKYFQNKETFE